MTLFVCRLLFLGGVYSFQCNTTLSRLVVLSVGVFAAALIHGSLWWSDNEVKRTTTFWGFTLGYVAVLSSRIWYDMHKISSLA